MSSGEIRSGKVIRGKPYPRLPGFTTIPAWSRGAGEWKTLSPMINLEKMGKTLEIEDKRDLDVFRQDSDSFGGVKYCPIFENYWQGGKIYRVDLIDPSLPVTLENLKSSFWARRDQMFSSEKGKRRALPKKYGYPISSYYRQSIMDWITSRKLIYAPLYQKIYQDFPAYQELKERHLAGENLLIVGPDGYDETISLDLEKLDSMINDTSLIFGHELVLSAMLLGKDYLSER